MMQSFHSKPWSKMAVAALEHRARQIPPAAWLVGFLRAPGRPVEFARYVGASAAAFAFDTAVFMLLIQAAAFAPTPAAALGYASGMLLNYLLCVSFIYRVEQTGKSQNRLIAEYVASGVFGLLLTTGLIAFLTGYLSLPPLPAKVITVAIVFVSIYLVRSGKIFAPRAA
jgi:putative flippase GtrA